MPRPAVKDPGERRVPRRIVRRITEGDSDDVKAGRPDDRKVGRPMLGEQEGKDAGPAGPRPEVDEAETDKRAAYLSLIA